MFGDERESGGNRARQGCTQPTDRQARPPRDPAVTAQNRARGTRREHAGEHMDADVEVPDVPVPEKNDLELTEARNGRVGPSRSAGCCRCGLRRSVGAWCFIDHYGPMDVDGMSRHERAAPPAHRTPDGDLAATGNVLHRDSLGSEQLIRPGQLNLMTSGRGIAHAEESPAEHDPTTARRAVLGGAAGCQPARRTRIRAPRRAAADRPRRVPDQLSSSVTWWALSSPATTFSPIVGAQLSAAGRPASCVLPLRPDFEHVIFVATGEAGVDGVRLRPGQLFTSRPGGTRRRWLRLPTARLSCSAACRLASRCSCGGTSSPAPRKRLPRPPPHGGRRVRSGRGLSGRSHACPAAGRCPPASATLGRRRRRA